MDKLLKDANSQIKGVFANSDWSIIYSWEGSTYRFSSVCRLEKKYLKLKCQILLKVKESDAGEPLGQGQVRVRLDCNDEVIQVKTL